MSANVVQLERVFRRSSDWSPRELAEFYRVESALIQAGLRLETDRGLSDEGHPWFAFCRPDDGEVIVHIARIDGVYILAGPSYDGIATGADIAALVRDLIARHPLIQTTGNGRRQGSNIFLHPAALLIAVVATAFFKSTEARALTEENRSGGDNRGGAAAGGSAARSETISVEVHKTIAVDAVQSAIVLAAVASVLQAAPAAATNHDVAAAILNSAPDLLPYPAHSSESVSPLNASSISPASEAHQPSSPHQASHMLGGLGPAVGSIATGGSTAAVLSYGPAQPADTDSEMPAHVGPEGALPLIVVLSDLAGTSKNPGSKVLAHEAVRAADAPSAAVAVQSTILTLKMAASSDASQDLPIVQSAKISFPSNQGSVETKNIAKVDQLPTALANLLKDATHATVDSKPLDQTSHSLANTILLSLEDKPADKSNPANDVAHPTKGSSVIDNSSGTKILGNAAVTKSADNATTTKITDTKGDLALDLSSGTTGTSVPKGGSSKDSSPTIDTKPVQLADEHHNPNASDISGYLQNYFDHTPTWTIVNNGIGVVVYDTLALAGHANDLVSATFDFSDGSTLSLVGLPAALPHFLVA